MIPGVLAPIRNQAPTRRPSYLDDLVLEYRCMDGAAAYPTLTDGVGSAGATIVSDGPAATYPGGQPYPYFDGANDRAVCSDPTMGNFAGSFAICMWADLYIPSAGLNMIAEKGRASSNERQFIVYQFGSNLTFLVSGDGSGYGYVNAPYPSGAGELFYCFTYQYAGDGTSKARVFTNQGAGGALSLRAESDSFPGPLFSTSHPLTIADRSPGTGTVYPAEMTLYRFRAFSFGADRAPHWTDGTFPAAELVRGDGHA